MSNKSFSGLGSFISKHTFPVSMALLMVYGMELYNHVLMSGELNARMLLSPFSELIPMAVAVLVVEHLLGSRIVALILAHLGDPSDLRLPYGIVMGTVTCVAMCPLMSMVATLAFKHPTLANVAPLWLSTFARNLPFALAWALLVARPTSAAITKAAEAGAK